VIVETRAKHLVYQYMVLGVQNLSVYPVSGILTQVLFSQFRNNYYLETVDDIDLVELRYYSIKKIIVIFILKAIGCYRTGIH